MLMSIETRGHCGHSSHLRRKNSLLEVKLMPSSSVRMVRKAAAQRKSPCGINAVSSYRCKFLMH